MIPPRIKKPLPWSPSRFILDNGIRATPMDGYEREAVEVTRDFLMSVIRTTRVKFHQGKT